MTQREFAQLLGTTQATYTLVESGRQKPSTMVLVKLEEEFGFSATEILFGDPPPPFRHQLRHTSDAINVYHQLDEASRTALDQVSYALFDRWLEPADVESWVRERKAASVARKIAQTEEARREVPVVSKTGTYPSVPGAPIVETGSDAWRGTTFRVMNDDLADLGYESGSMWKVAPTQNPAANAVVVLLRPGDVGPVLFRVNRHGDQLELCTSNPRQKPELWPVGMIKIVGVPFECIQRGHKRRRP